MEKTTDAIVENAAVESYRLISIDRTAAPRGAAGDDWLVYQIARGTNVITGYRRGNHQDVAAELVRIVSGFNARLSPRDRRYRSARPSAPPPRHEVRREEKEVRELRTELAHVARLAMLGQLTASIGHEVKQPLTAIVTNAATASILLGDGANHPNARELREILGDIETEGRLAADVIDRMRELSRKRPLCLASIDLNSLVTETMRFLEGDTRRRHVALVVDLGPSLPPVRADRVCVQQVLLSLSLNAMEAMEDVEPAARGMLLRTRAVGNEVEFTISDTGRGIPDDVFGRLFEPFFTTKSDGLGLGLAIARSIVDAHRGRIWAANDGGVGATFHIVLPAASESQKVGGIEARKRRPRPHALRRAAIHAETVNRGEGPGLG